MPNVSARILLTQYQPFRAFLDVGIQPTTTGARVFSVLKGAADGGLEGDDGRPEAQEARAAEEGRDRPARDERLRGLHRAPPILRGDRRARVRERAEDR